jgi:hypothetical protein
MKINGQPFPPLKSRAKMKEKGKKWLVRVSQMLMYEGDHCNMEANATFLDLQ